MRVEYYTSDDEAKRAIATATWDGEHVTVEASDDRVRAALAQAFRRTTVLTDDASRRRLGTSGPVAVEPGNLEWFRLVARDRATTETGLAARFVPGAVTGGWDPAANYRRFDEQIERLDARSRS